MHRYKAQELEVADAASARQEERAARNYRHRMQYCHAALAKSDELLRSMQDADAEDGYLEAIEREVWATAQALSSFGTAAQSAAVLKLADACAARRSDLITRAASTLRQAVGADFAPQPSP